MTRIALVLDLIGLLLQIAGVLLMANGYTGMVRATHLPRLLLSALVRGPVARGAARVGTVTPEDRLRSLHGLSLVGVGFLLQAVSKVLLLST